MPEGEGNIAPIGARTTNSPFISAVNHENDTSTPNGNAPVPDWNAIRVRLKSRYSNRFRLSTEDDIVNLRKWGHFAARFPSTLKIVPFPGSATLNAYANRVAAKISGIQSPLVVGVHRKGLSILREVADRLPALKIVPVVSDRSPPEDLAKAVHSKQVLIIDDSIHGGEKSAALSRRLRDLGAGGIEYLPLVATDEGSKEVRGTGAGVDSFLSVPLSEFGEVWDKVLIPAILNLRYGPLSNLMESRMSIDGPLGSVEDQVVEVLGALIETNGVEFLAETVETSATAPVFHGDVELSEGRCEAVFQDLRKNDPDFQKPSEAKLRLFFLGTSPMDLHFTAVVHWHTKGSEKSYRILERRSSDILLNDLLADFQARLQVRGLTAVFSVPAYPGEEPAAGR